jgi:SM-20-related protein
LSVSIIDDVFDADTHAKIFSFLSLPTWGFGWKSDVRNEHSFWHKHFAGNIRPDHVDSAGAGQQYDCAEELKRRAPLIYDQWLALSAAPGPMHRCALTRCYANGFTYGNDGSVHTDSRTEGSLTAVYYPNPSWDPNWGGETVLFNQAKTDIDTSVDPRPNRLVVFPGIVPHVARGVSRTCPVMRITLVFKMERPLPTEIPDSL